MPVTMTGQGAVARISPRIRVFQYSVEWSHVIRIKIDQVGVTGGSMRVVAGHAGTLGNDHMPLVLGETFVGENAGSVVAFVAEGIGIGRFSIEVSKRQLAFENGCKD